MVDISAEVDDGHSSDGINDGQVGRLRRGPRKMYDWSAQQAAFRHKSGGLTETPCCVFRMGAYVSQLQRSSIRRYRCNGARL